MGRTGNGLFRGIGYDPLPSQKAFHRSRSRFKGFSGPIGSGKSQALCHEAIRMSYLNPGRMGLVGAPTFPMLRDATQAALFELLESNRIPFEHNKAENVTTLTDTKSRIIFRSVDEFERLRGTNLAWFGLDELTYSPEGAWLRLEGRLRDPKAKRLCGFAVWTPKGFDWVYRRFFSDRVSGYAAIVAKPFENRHLLSQVPDFYERLKGSYDERFYQQEVLGSYLALTGGRVYWNFSRNDHVTDLQPDRNRTLFWALDFNVDPMCSVIAQRVDGVVRVLDELYLRNTTTYVACKEFLEKFPEHNAEVVVYGDASGYQHRTTGSTDYEMIRECFAANGKHLVRYGAPRTNPQIRDRVNLTNAMLRSASGNIGLLVDRKCKELIKDLEQVSYKEDSNQIDKERDRMRTHLSDALGYLLWQEGKQLPGIGPREGRLF
ncbi:MAG: terminase family protein [Bryobacteraceae bacterium]